MSPRPSDRRRPSRAALVLAAAVVVGACASEDAPGVGVETVASDLVFGVEANTPVANFDPEPVADPDSVQADAELPPQVFEPLNRPGVTFPPVRPADPVECPTAEINEFPDESAGFWHPEDHKEPPREGLYRWKRSGTLQGPEGSGFSIPVRGFERRLVRNVDIESDEENTEGGNDLTFTYEVVQPEVSSGNTVITTYRMRTDGESRTVFSPVDDTQIRTGEPDRGLAITKIEVVDREGNSETFEPATPLLVFPIAVVPGDEFQASAFDPRTRETAAISAKVTARERVDACGDLVEGWAVESTLTRSGGGDQVARRYDFMVAPQYGGIIIREHIAETGPDPVEDVIFELAQQDPDPIPAGGDGQ